MRRQVNKFIFGATVTIVSSLPFLIPGCSPVGGLSMSAGDPGAVSELLTGVGDLSGLASISDALPVAGVGMAQTAPNQMAIREVEALVSSLNVRAAGAPVTVVDVVDAAAAAGWSSTRVRLDGMRVHLLAGQGQFDCVVDVTGFTAVLLDCSPVR